MRASPLSRFFPMAGFVGVLVALDQLIKYLVETRLPFHELVPVIPLFGLYRTWNEGIAFSMLSGMPDTGLLVLTLAVGLFVVYLWRRSPPERLIAHLGFGLILGGAVGNLIDRAVYGHVVDYLLFYTSTWSFAVFNLADAFITCGATLIVLDEVIAVMDEKRNKERSASAGQTNGDKKEEGNP